PTDDLYQCPTLDNDVDDFLSTSVADLKLSQPIKVHLYLPKTELTRVEATQIPGLIRMYYLYRMTRLRRDQKRLINEGLHTLLWTIFVDIFMYILRVVIMIPLAEKMPNTATQECVNFLTGLVEIASWAIFWPPVEKIFHGWRPLSQDRLMCKKLADVPVTMMENTDVEIPKEAPTRLSPPRMTMSDRRERERLRQRQLMARNKGMV
ncbi:hypothetical protein KIPB_003363, partial [Kipferlia bialata]